MESPLLTLLVAASGVEVAPRCSRARLRERRSDRSAVMARR